MRASHHLASLRSLARATRTRPLTCARPPSVDKPRLRPEMTIAQPIYIPYGPMGNILRENRRSVPQLPVTCRLRLQHHAFFLQVLASFIVFQHLGIKNGHRNVCRGRKHVLYGLCPFKHYLEFIVIGALIPIIDRCVTILHYKCVVIQSVLTVAHLDTGAEPKTSK